MGCITNVSFVVLINGVASPFSLVRGVSIRDALCLPFCSFLLLKDWANWFMQPSKGDNSKLVTINLFITHLFFFDDILLFFYGFRGELSHLKIVLDLFLKATRMSISAQKYSITHNGLSGAEINRTLSLFPFGIKPLSESIKYLCFPLKPNSYRKSYWKWLVAKIEKWVKHWSFKWISRAGCMVFIESALMVILVYWIMLTWVLKGVLTQIRKFCGRFLWVGLKENEVFPWVAWEKISHPKEWGGWGIKDISRFSHSMVAKLGWHLLTKDNLWTSMIKK